MSKEVMKLNWADVGKLAAHVGRKIAEDNRGKHVALYGVPNGGIHAAQLVYNYACPVGGMVALTTQPEDGNVVIVDDIIDSGKTRDDHQQRYDDEFGRPRPFYALIDLQGEHKHLKGKWLEFPWESMKRQDGPQDAVRRLIQYAGDDPDRDGLKETPDRVVKSYGELFSGYKTDPKSLFKCFDDPSYDQMVVLKDVEVHSFCEHHMLPFHGRAHVAYVPKGRVIGLSKLARLVEVFARRLQVQERLTQQVVQALNEGLGPLGAACVIEAKHHCVCARGVGKQHSTMITSALTGCFLTDGPARAEFFNMIRS
jgi:GTP cyclohydrolase IA